MRTTTRFAGALLTTGLALGTYAAPSASAAEMPATASNAASPETASAAIPARDVDTKAECWAFNAPSWSIPDGEGAYAGSVEWHDNDGSQDLDNFFISDTALDAQSSSLYVINNSTGEDYYKHVYSGDAYCMGVGNIRNGETAWVKACGWNNGNVEECTYKTIEE